MIHHLFFVGAAHVRGCSSGQIPGRKRLATITDIRDRRDIT